MAGGPSLPNGRHLTDRLRRLDDARERYFAVRLQVLRGNQLVGQPWPSAVIRQPLVTLAENASATLYALDPADFVLLCDNLSVDYVDKAVERALRLFPNATPSGTSPPMARASWYDLMRDEDLKTLISAAEAAAAREHRGADQDSLRPITIADVSPILDRIERFPIERIIRRQHVLRVSPPGRFTAQFRELYVSVSEFQRVLAPGIDTAAHPDLFRHLAAAVDRKILTYLTEQGGTEAGQQPLCITLDISSASLPTFGHIEKLFAGTGKLLLEISLHQILDNLESFQHFQKRMQQNDIGLVLGGVTPTVLPYIDLSRMDMSFIKLPCPQTASFESGKNIPKSFLQCIERVGQEGLILTGIEKEERLRWALGIGINRFQGRLADILISTLAAKKAI